MRFSSVFVLTLTALILGAGAACSQVEKPNVRLDALGEPLPPGVLSRMGGLRLDLGSAIGSAFFSNDGKSIAVSPDRFGGAELTWFDLTTGAAGRKLALPQGACACIPTPDESLLVVRSFYQTNNPVVNFAEIHVLDAKTGKSKWRTDPKRPFDAVALSLDGKLVAGGLGESAGKASDVYLWDAATGKQLAILKGHSTPLRALAFSADGKRLVSVAPSETPVAASEAVPGTAILWEIAEGKLVKKISASGRDYVVAPDGRTVAFTTGNWRHTKDVTLWDVVADTKIATLPLPNSRFRFTPDGKALVTGSHDAMLHIWDAQTGREIRSFKGLVGSGVRPLAFSRDGKRLATFAGFGHDGALRIWDVASGTECTPAAGHALNITCLAFTADGKSLVSGSDDRTVRLWETKTGKELKSLAGHNASLSAVAISPDGKTIVSGDENAVVQIWDATRGKSLHRLALKAAGDKPAAHESKWISFALFAADGKTVWIGSQTKLLRGELAEYDVATGKRLRAVSQPDSYPRALSPDASLSVWTQRLRPKDETDRAFGNWEEKVVVRKMGPMHKGEVAYPIKNDEYKNNSLVNRVTFSPDGKFILLHSNWLAVGLHRAANVPCFRMIEAATGKDVVNKSSADYPWTLFVPGGPTLAGSYTIELPLAPVSGFVRHDLPALGVVNATTDKVVAQLPSYPRHGGITAVSSNAEFLATVAGNRTILVWDVSKLGRK